MRTRKVKITLSHAQGDSNPRWDFEVGSFSEGASVRAKRLLMVVSVAVGLTGLFALAYTGFSGFARAAGPLYVATSGNDSNDCLAPATACQTINGAISKASAGDTVRVAVGTFTGAGSEVVLVDRDINLSGGWDAAFVSQTGLSTVDGEQSRRALVVSAAKSVLIEYFAIQNGAGPTSGGGGIFNLGDLTVENSTIVDNSSHGGTQGGGILTRGGTLSLTNSIVSGNVANSGAGLYSDGGSTVNVSDSTFVDNVSSGQGGALYVFSSSLTLENTTIRNNTANTAGGGLYQNGGDLNLLNSTVSRNSTNPLWAGGGLYIIGSATVLVNNSTIAYNEAGRGGGIHLAGDDTTTLRNTIIANNIAGSSPDCRAVKNPSDGYNLVGDSAGCSLSPLPGDLLDVNPLLGPLQDNGGTTWTHELLPASVAVNAGHPATPGSGGDACEATDQRSVDRPEGFICDIGAFEASSGSPSNSVGLIHGTVTDIAGAPLAGMCVLAYENSIQQVPNLWHALDTGVVVESGFAETSSSGVFSMEVPAGASYFLYAWDCDAGWYEFEWFSNAGDLADADLIAVNGGDVTVVPSIVLRESGDVVGVVTDATTGRPLNGIEVWSTDWSGFWQFWFAVTDSNGEYYLPGLRQDADHRVQFFDPTGKYRLEWFNNRSEFNSADAVSVVSGFFIDGIDAVLATNPGDPADEMFFYRDDGLFRYYNINPSGTLSSPILQGDGYTKGWSSITAVDLDGSGFAPFFHAFGSLNEGVGIDNSHSPPGQKPIAPADDGATSKS